MKNKLIFITGTDTNVGKTIAVSVLAKYYQQNKFRVGIIKPIQSGPDQDISQIKKLAGLDNKQVFCPIFLKYPLAPEQAAKKEKKPPIDTKGLLKIIRNFAQDFEITLIEGSGGLYVPIRPKYMVIDLIKDLRAETILVSRTALGTINHTVMSVKLLQAKRIPIKGIIYNSPQKFSADLSIKQNPAVIQEITGIKTLGIFPYQKKIDIPKLVKYITM